MKFPADIEGEEVLGDEVPVSKVNEALEGLLDSHPEFDFNDSRQAPKQVFDRVCQVVDAGRGGRLVSSNRLGGQTFLSGIRSGAGEGERRDARKRTAQAPVTSKMTASARDLCISGPSEGDITSGNPGHPETKSDNVQRCPLPEPGGTEEKSE